MRRFGQFTGLFITITILMMLFGCQAKSAYSFENPDIFAYINGEPVYESQKDTYVEMKKAYYSDILNSIQKNEEADVAESDLYNEMLGKTYETELNRMRNIVSYSDEEWQKDYLRTFIIEKQLYGFVGEKKDSFSEFENSTIDTAVQDALHPNGVKLDIYNVASLNVEDVINRVSEKSNMSYEDCANTVYADFVKREFQYQYLSYYFAGSEFQGDKIEWNGTNVKEYTAYMLNVTSQYEDYLTRLLESADIVMRQ